MIIVGSLNSLVFDKVHNFIFIDSSLEVHSNNNELMNVQDVKETKDLLTETLRMLSVGNSCNVIKFNSNKNAPETLDKMECRGQIEMIKRLLVNVSNDDKLTPKNKESADRQDTAEDIQKYSDDESQPKIDPSSI